MVHCGIRMLDHEVLHQHLDISLLYPSSHPEYQHCKSLRINTPMECSVLHSPLLSKKDVQGESQDTSTLNRAMSDCGVISLLAVGGRVRSIAGRNWVAHTNQHRYSATVLELCKFLFLYATKRNVRKGFVPLKICTLQTVISF